MSLHRTGYIPDQRDPRDRRVMSVSIAAAEALPDLIDTSAGFVEMYDQGNCNGCVGNSGSALFEYFDRKQGGSNIKPSRLAAYYLARREDGWESFDGGASIRSLIKAFVSVGMVQEKNWPYDLNKINVAPPGSALADAALHQAIQYARVDQNNGALRSSLAAGRPFIFGMTLYENFQAQETLRTGIVPFPAGSIIGGHAMIGAAHDRPKRRYKCYNPWGPRVGDGGWFYIPEEMIENPGLSGDFWTLLSVEETDVIIPVPPQPLPPKPQPKPTPLPQVKRHFAGYVQKTKTAGGVLITPLTPEDKQESEGMKGVLVDITER